MQRLTQINTQSYRPRHIQVNRYRQTSTQVQRKTQTVAHQHTYRHTNPGRQTYIQIDTQTQKDTGKYTGTLTDTNCQTDTQQTLTSTYADRLKDRQTHLDMHTYMCMHTGCRHTHRSHTQKGMHREHKTSTDRLPQINKLTQIYTHNEKGTNISTHRDAHTCSTILHSCTPTHIHVETQLIGGLVACIQGSPGHVGRGWCWGGR